MKTETMNINKQELNFATNRQVYFIILSMYLSAIFL